MPRLRMPAGPLKLKAIVKVTERSSEAIVKVTERSSEELEPFLPDLPELADLIKRHRLALAWAQGRL